MARARTAHFALASIVAATMISFQSAHEPVVNEYLNLFPEVGELITLQNVVRCALSLQVETP